MAGAPLESIHVAGLASIRDLTLDLASEVTLLVGANGAGKSNIVDAFELIGRIVDGQLQEHVLQSGGFSSLVHRSSDPASGGEDIELEVRGAWSGDNRNGYRAHLSPGPEDSALLSEWSQYERPEFGQIRNYELGQSRESQLRARAEKFWKEDFVLRVASGCRVFHFDDVSQNAPPKTRARREDNLTLSPDAGNIAAVVLRMREEEPDRYERVVRVIQTVAPYFGDFVLVPSRSDDLLLRWSERGLDGVFSADRLSDGTLRFVCLAVLLLQPDPPHTIVLDEPELGLHPFAIHQLAELLRGVSAESRVVAATQSVTLLSRFGIEDIAVVERGVAGTTVIRHDPADFAQWLDLYSLGEMWEKNLLGGRPRPDGLVRGTPSS